MALVIIYLIMYGVIEMSTQETVVYYGYKITFDGSKTYWSYVYPHASPIKCLSLFEAKWYVDKAIELAYKMNSNQTNGSK